MDTLLGGQLWMAAKNWHQTDVEFLIGDRVVPAHRSILAARSSFWEHHFKSKPNGKQICLDDVVDQVDATVFENLLCFTYTGQLKMTPDQQLWKLAQRCQLQTLIQLCESASKIQNLVELEELLREAHFNDLPRNIGNARWVISLKI